MEQLFGKNHKIVKFVPASGAASRCFKNLFEFLGENHTVILRLIILKKVFLSK